MGISPFTFNVIWYNTYLYNLLGSLHFGDKKNRPNVICIYLVNRPVCSFVVALRIVHTKWFKSLNANKSQWVTGLSKKLRACVCCAVGRVGVHGRGYDYTAVAGYPWLVMLDCGHAPGERQVSWLGVHAVSESCTAGRRSADGIILWAVLSPGAASRRSGRVFAGRCSMQNAFGCRKDSTFRIT